MILVPVYEGFDLLDVAGPLEMFRWAQIPAAITARKPGLVRSGGGVALQVDVAFDAAPHAKVLWVPGGNPEDLARLIEAPAATYLNFLRHRAATADIVASVCEGALLLAATGLLDGYEITTHWRFEPCLRSHFPAVNVANGHPRYHWDRNRLTGGGISSGLDEALELVRHLKGEAAAVSVQQTTQYYPAPPVSSTIPTATDCPLDPFWRRP